MPDVLGVIIIGLVLGMRHATDADHVVAITTIVSRQRSASHAAMIGALWGIGHTVTIGLVGAAIIGFNLVVPARIGLTLELSVGLMLVLLGVLNLSGVMESITDRMTPPARKEAGGTGRRDEPQDSSRPASQETHSHENGWDCELGWLDRSLGKLGLYQALRPLAVGIVHGLAGSAAVALLVLATIRNPYWAFAYLLVFGAGTVAGMMAITTVIALPLAYTATRFDRLNRGLVVASGLISLGFGLLISYHIGIGGGLFTSHPVWTPR